MPDELAPGHRQVPGQRRAAGQHHGVELRLHLGRRAHLDVGGARHPEAAFLARLGRSSVARLVPATTDRRRAHERDALGLHLGQSAVQHGLLHLELGDPVAQQPARLLRPLEHGHRVPGPHQLLGGRQAGRSRADHRHRLARADRGHLRGHPPLVPGALDDLVLDPLDRDRVLVDPEHARRLARCRAQPSRELGEVVGGVQALHRLRPVVPVHKVVPLRDQVAERAAVMAEGDAAVHAASSLLLGGLLVEGLVDLLPVAQPDRDGPPPGQLAAVLHEARRLTHARPP